MTTPANLDHPCATHGQRRCLVCYPPVGVWVDHGGGDWARLDADGTRWAVCPDRPGVWTLGMRYRDHRLVSEHPSKEAAMKHRDELVAALARIVNPGPGDFARTSHRILIGDNH